MPKIEFETEKEFNSWLKKITKTRKYSLYVVSEDSNIIAIPLVSTKPINYGILHYSQLHDANSVATSLSGMLRIPLFKVRSLEFTDFKTK